jgi:predicted GIY-YIG superfamily endonuclease
VRYVYLLQSIEWPTRTYVGQTTDLRKRLAAHNAGQSAHTARHKPWKLTTYFAFADESTAISFEHYLKSASGRAFSKKHFRIAADCPVTGTNARLASSHPSLSQD